VGQSEDTTAPAPGGSTNATSTAQPPDADPPSSISSAQTPSAEPSGGSAASALAPAIGEAPTAGEAPAPAPSQGEPPLGPVEGPDLPSQFNTTFEQDPDVANGTVIIVLKDKDEPPPASLTDAVEIKKKYDGTSKGALLAKVSANETIASTIEKAMADPSVKYAEPNYILRASDVAPNDPDYSGYQWNMPKISMPKAWGFSTGATNVLVCVIDTGIDYNHPDLAPNMASGNSAAVNGLPSVSLTKGFNAITDAEDAMDDNRHGSHCAGVIGAKGDNSMGIAGVNWSVKLTGCKFLSAGGSGYTSDALQCLDWCVNGAGAKISSNSWGGGGYSQSMKDAIAAAEASNQHLFIAAAGNDRNDNDVSPSYPASYPLPNVISVAATDSSDALASFSNYGTSSVHIAAPGVNIYSTVPTAAYASYSGTSMACPHVAGAAAMLLGIDINLTAQEIKTMIMSYGDSVPGLSGKVVGTKRLNVGAAVEYLSGRTPGTPIPAPPSPPPPAPRASPVLTVVETLTPSCCRLHRRRWILPTQVLQTRQPSMIASPRSVGISIRKGCCPPATRKWS
jgi:subtilisin family serine protease